MLEVEASDDTIDLLATYGQPAHLPRETPYEREQRLATFLNCILLWIWADETPISRRTIQFHLWGVLFNHLQFESSASATDFCSEPQLLAVMPGSATGAFLSSVMAEIVKDMQELGHMADDGHLALDDGTELTWKLRMDKADSPMLAHKGGKSSAGNAHQKCACCNASVFMYRDTRECMTCTSTSLQAVDTFARKAAAIGNFSAHIDVRAARVETLKELLRHFDQPVHVDELKPELEARAIALCDGVVSVPQVLGGLPYGSVPQMNGVQLFYDYALHGVKGLAEIIRTEIKRRLSKSDTTSFQEMEKACLGNKTYYSGKQGGMVWYGMGWGGVG
jgi:hypothetical protein